MTLSSKTVWGASTGAAFASDETLTAYRQWLLPRASLITPNAREAARLCGETRPDPVRHAQDLIGMDDRDRKSVV